MAAYVADYDVLRVEMSVSRIKGFARVRVGPGDFAGCVIV